MGRSEPLQRNCPAQLVGMWRAVESVTEVLLERGGLCDKREGQVLACGRGTFLVRVDSRKQCHMELVCVIIQGSTLLLR